MSGSDDSDSDYDPNDVQQEIEIESEEIKLTSIPKFRQNKLDAIFNDMLEEDAQYINKAKEKSISHKRKDTPKTGNSSNKKTLDLLSTIFGKSNASSMVTSIGSKKRAIDEDSSEIKNAALHAARKVQKSTKVAEKVKFAGQEISIQRTVMSSSQPATSSSIVSALDKVIEELKGPKSISTVTKSSSDWDNFKEKEGLEDDLAVAAKDGYLHRKDFLERCDVRAFETERDVRLQNAAKNML